MVDYSDLIGIPFKNRGRDKDTGLDCYGLVREVYKKCGIDLPEYNADYNDKRKINAIIKEQMVRQCWQRIEADELVVPCVMAIRFGAMKGVINHTGVYIGNGKFLHTRNNIGVCVDRIDSPAWRRNIEGFFKYVGG